MKTGFPPKKTDTNGYAARAKEPPKKTFPVGSNLNKIVIKNEIY